MSTEGADSEFDGTSYYDSWVMGVKDLLKEF